MMKRRISVVLLAVLILGVGSLFGQEPEVSKKKDVSIFKVYASVNMPDAAKMYFDNTIIGVVKGLGRFNVIGFQYHLSEGSVAKFVEKVKALKKESIMNDTKLIDPELGEVIIAKEDLYKMVNSFFVFIPQISGWRTWERHVEAKKDSSGNILVKAYTEYLASVTVSVRIINAEGNLMDIYNITKEATSKKSPVDAYEKAIRDTTSGMILFLRNTDEFKIKTRVLKREGGKVALQLGKDMGIRSGYEFKMQVTETMMGDFKTTSTKGLVRVIAPGDNFSWAKILQGNPEVNMQLIEAPMMNMRSSLYFGMSTMRVSSANISFTYIDESPAPDTITTTLSIKESSMVPDVGIKGEAELGYAGLAAVKVGLLINAPLGLYIDMGVGYELYLGMFSIDLGADLSVLGSILPLEPLQNTTGYIQVNDTIFYGSSVNVSLMGVSLGAKARIGINAQFSQKFKLRFYGGFQAYPLEFYRVNFTDPSDSEISDQEKLGESNVYFTVNGQQVNRLPIDYLGPFGGIELMFRF